MGQVQTALAVLEQALTESQSPYVLSSFGKDSLAVLDLAAQLGVRRVLYLEDRDEIVDEDHIRRTIERFKLEVTRMESGRAFLYFIDGEPLLVGLPFVNHQVMIPVPTNLDPYKIGEPYWCVDDRLRALHGRTIDTGADLLIAGFKLADWSNNTCRIAVDKLGPESKARYLGRYRTVMDIGGGVRMVMPLLTWSHADVWAYLQAREIEVSPRMYAGQEKRPHVNRVCLRCHDPKLPGKVFCPKLQAEITNLAHFTQDADHKLEALARMGLIDHDDVKHLQG